MSHLPGYVKAIDQFKAKGVDVVAVIAANDAFVMSGWGRIEGVKDKVRSYISPGLTCVSLYGERLLTICRSSVCLILTPSGHRHWDFLLT